THQTSINCSKHIFSLHDALPICGIGDLRTNFEWDKVIAFASHNHAEPFCLQERPQRSGHVQGEVLFRAKTAERTFVVTSVARIEDRKSTRLNSSHVSISYAVFCL